MTRRQCHVKHSISYSGSILEELGPLLGLTLCSILIPQHWTKQSEETLRDSHIGQFLQFLLAGSSQSIPSVRKSERRLHVEFRMFCYRVWEVTAKKCGASVLLLFLLMSPAASAPKMFFPERFALLCLSFSHANWCISSAVLCLAAFYYYYCSSLI